MNNSFINLGLTPFFVGRLAERGINVPTNIQSLVIPELLSKRNTLFSSATGTGKTFAFLIPLFQHLLDDDSAKGGPFILIAAPTYELCSQIKKEADFLLQGTSIKTTLLIGSANTSRQIDALKKDRPQVIIGNPGRILQLCRMKKLKLQQIRAFVLDEGDRLVSMNCTAKQKNLHRLCRKKESALPVPLR